MATRHWSLVLLSAAMAVLAGCGGSTLNLQNPPPPPGSAQVAISFSPAPPTSLPLNGTAPLIATVSNDPSTSGVDWSLNCSTPGTCGSISPSHTPSGQPTTYTPPATFPGNNKVVTVVAFATADHSRNVLAPITVTAFGGTLTGTYVIATNGSDFSGQPYQRAGVIALDGNGGVVLDGNGHAGEQTVNFVDPNSGAYTSVTDSVTGGSYFIGMDGRGQLVIKTNDVNIGQNGVETFSLVVLSSSHVLLTKLDDSALQGSSHETSLGTLDLQTAAPAPALGYAFVAGGTDTGGSAMGLGGVFNIDSPLTISGRGSAFDVASATNGPGVVTPSSAVSGTVSAQDAFGAFQIALATDFATVQFTAYPIDATHAKLIESDGSFGLTAGDTYSQGAATGTYRTRLNFKGNFVLGIFGRDLGGGNASLAAAGLFSTTGAGTLTKGYLDESQASDSVQISDTFHSVYGVGPGLASPPTTSDPAGTGRYYVPVSILTGVPNFTFGTRKNGTGPDWVFYMTTTGGPVLMLDADVEPTLASGLPAGGVGTGIAYPVVAGSAISGSYGTVFTQNMQGVEVDVAGEITANNNALSGVLDLNSLNGPQQDDTSLTGTYQTSPIANRLTGSLSDTFFAGDQGNNLGMAFYPIDPSQGFFVENDLADSAGSPISGVLTFGHYSTRTPVCQGCP